MFVGVLRLTLHIPHARSLKERRKVVRSFKDRVSSRLRASVAEVGGLDQYQRAVLGVAVVSKDAARVDEILSNAASMAGSLRDAVLTDRCMEIIPFGDEGQGLGMMQGDRIPDEESEQ
jgi:uncharacterized protein YlxP (DUF503 family)